MRRAITDLLYDCKAKENGPRVGKRKSQLTMEDFIEICSSISEDTFPKGKCKERGQLLVFIGKLAVVLQRAEVIK